jgi:hypothetical protein
VFVPGHFLLPTELTLFEIVPRHDKLFTTYIFEIVPMFINQCLRLEQKNPLEASTIQCGQTYMLLALLFAPFPWFEQQ